MTLRVALVIDGDPAGAKKALTETGAAVEDLGRKADAANKSAETAGRRFEWAGDQASKAGDRFSAAAGETGGLASGLADAGAAGEDAAPKIDRAGVAAGAAAPKFGSLKSAIGGLALGFAAGFGVAVVAEAFNAAIGGAAGLAREIASSQPRIERDLERHAELIGRIKGLYAEAQGAASSYGRESAALLRFETQQNVARLERDLEDQLPRPTDFGGGAFNRIMQQGERLGPFRDLVNGILGDVRKGTADIIAFREEVARIGETLPAESSFRRLAETILEDTEAVAKTQAELARARDLLSGLKGDADAAATALGGSAGKYRDLGGAAGEAAPPLGETASAIGGTGREAAGALPALGEYERTLRRIAEIEAGLPSPARMAVTPIVGGGSYAAGGFTGHLPESEIAGFVHGQEYVFDAASTRAIGVGNLEAIRRGVRGYAAGGFAGGTVPATVGGGLIVAATAEDFSVLRGSLRQFLSELIDSGDAMAALGSVVKSVSDRFLDFALNALDNLVFTGSAGGGGAGGVLGWLGTAFAGAGAFPPAPLAPAGLYHGGGRAGPSPAVSRRVPVSVFASAPRMHSGGSVGGLMAGERPVIAMDGEEIGWPDQLAAKYGGSRTVNNFYIETPTPRAFAESKATVARSAGRFLARTGRHM